MRLSRPRSILKAVLMDWNPGPPYRLSFPTFRGISLVYGRPRSIMSGVAPSSSDVSSIPSFIPSLSNSSGSSGVSPQISTGVSAVSRTVIASDSSIPFMSLSTSSGPIKQFSSAASLPTLPVKGPTTSFSEATTQPNPPMASIPSSPSRAPNTTAKAAALSSTASDSFSPASAVVSPPPGSSQGSAAGVKSSTGVGGQKSQADLNTTVKPTPSPGSTKAPAASSSDPAGSVGNTEAANGGKISFTGTTTSTITDAPESTLSTPSFVSVVVNGKTSFSAPPLVTILSTSTEANGSFVTFTHVVANPSGFSQAISGGHSSFFHNAGAVAGVFLVIGAIIAGIAAYGIFILCRRRRRRRERHRKWLISINRPRPLAGESQDPFQDPRNDPSPPMRTVEQSWPRPPHQYNPGSGLGLYDVPPARHKELPEEHEGHYNATDSNTIGLAITTNDSKPSLAQSSPSVYPPSLPPAHDDHAFEEVQLQPQRYSDSSGAPPRPRRSHLRDPPSTAQLVTPPSSVSSHSPVSEITGPFGSKSPDSEPSSMYPVQLNDIIQRRTLLDVRPRSRDSVTSKVTTLRG